MSGWDGYDYEDQMSRSDLEGYECQHCGKTPESEYELQNGWCTSYTCELRREHEHQKHLKELENAKGK